MSHFTKGQNVFTNYIDTSFYESFVSAPYLFPSKYNTSELLTVEQGIYRIKRLSDQNQSIAFLKTDKTFYEYKVSAQIALVGKRDQTSAGLLLHSQTSTSGGIFIEINNQRRFRAYRQNGISLRLLSGSPIDDGWIKNKAINKKGANTLTVKVKGGYFDIYINNTFCYTLFDTQFNNGKIGLFVNATTEALFSEFFILQNPSTVKEIISETKGEEVSLPKEEDPQFEEVIRIFKVKIDKQQKELATLQRELDKCRSMVHQDTTLVSKAARLESDNRVLLSRLDSTTRELQKGKRRLEYLESIKEDIENGDDGDLVLSLTSILSDVKKDNKALKEQLRTTQEESSALKKENEILLREIERIKYLLDKQE